MDRMLKSLNRWLKRDPKDVLRHAIFHTMLEDDLRGIPLEQLRSSTAMVPDFKKDSLALARAFDLFLKFDSHLPRMDQLGPKMKKVLPEFTGKEELVDFLGYLSTVATKHVSCVASVKSALTDFRDITDWDKVISIMNVPWPVCQCFPMSSLKRLSN